LQPERIWAWTIKSRHSEPDICVFPSVAVLGKGKRLEKNSAVYLSVGRIVGCKVVSSASQKSKIPHSYFFRSSLNALYFFGIILIGTRVLVRANYAVAVYLAFVTAVSYLILGYVSIRLTSGNKLGKHLLRESSLEVSNFLKAATSAALTTNAVIALVGGLTIVLARTMGSVKYYFYGLQLGLIMLIATFSAASEVYPSMDALQLDGIETLNHKLRLQMEFNRTFLWAFLTVIFVTALTQMYSGGLLTMTSGEMMLGAYTDLGAVGVIYAPLLVSVLRLISRIGEVGRKERR
jgi:hypothetical protein